MRKIHLILKQIRINHWVKNLVVFLPLFFGGAMFDISLIIDSFLVFIVFSFAASSIYILNDVQDLEEDRLHSEKKSRPLASGELSFGDTAKVFLLLSMLNFFILAYIGNFWVTLIVGSYYVINILYILVAKNYPLWDIFTISIIYLVRLEAGAIVTDIPVSEWLFITVFFGSMILILAKRYTEYRNDKVRKVMLSYNKKVLHTMLVASIAITIGSFTIYAVNQGSRYIPVVILFTFLLFRYYFLVETTKKAEKPEKLLISDKQLIFGIILLILYLGSILYF